MKSSRHALEEEGVQVIAGIGVNACSRNAIVVSQLNRPKQPPSIMHRLFTFSLTTGSYMGATLLRLVSKREMKWFQCHEYLRYSMRNCQVRGLTSKYSGISLVETDQSRSDSRIG